MAAPIAFWGFYSKRDMRVEREHKNSLKPTWDLFEALQIENSIGWLFGS